MSASRSFVKNYYAVGLVDQPAPAPNAAIDGDMSDDIIGPTTTTEKLDNMMYQIQWTSADAVGEFAIQVSTDGTQWDDITFSPSLQQPAADSDQYSILLGAMPNTLIRPIYRRTSGSGRCEIRFSAKGS